MVFDPEYQSQVLAEHFADAKALFLAPLLSIHRAHLVMLAERGIIDPGSAHALRDALEALSPDVICQARYDGTCEDLYSYVERLLVETCGEAAAGRLHTARSRNDIDMTMYRLRQREWLVGLIEAAIALRAALADVAGRHYDTLFAAHTHTQPAQPTTLAHYLLGVMEQLERDVARLRAAHASTNRCPLGACAITGTGFPIDRQLTSDLLGFDGPTGNTYGSIATVDYLLESASAAGILSAGLGRFVQDLLQWCSVEYGYLRLAEGFVQTSTIMPQKRNPVALEHARAIASKALGQVSAIALAVHNTPFGDIVDTEDDLQPLVAAMFRDTTRAVSVVGAAMRSAEFDIPRMEARAAAGGTTLTELADYLVRTRQLPFKTAHTIAARFGVACQAAGASTADAFRTVSQEVLGSDLELSQSELERVLSARHFVEVRETHGGPSPAQTRRALAEARELIDADRAWLQRTRAAAASAQVRLHARSRAL
jgi:argininosuccinate lyase